MRRNDPIQGSLGDLHRCHTDEMSASPPSSPATSKKYIWVAIGLTVLLFGGCLTILNRGGTSDATTGYETAVRKACADQVRNGIGQATFRDQEETSRPGSSGSTVYQATGRADVPGRSVTYRCEGTVAADAGKTLTVRVVAAS